MNSPEKSKVNVSRTLRCVKSSARIVVSPTTMSESASVTETSVMNVRVVRSLSSSARSSGLTARPR